MKETSEATELLFIIFIWVVVPWLYAYVKIHLRMSPLQEYTMEKRQQAVLGKLVNHL